MDAKGGKSHASEMLLETKMTTRKGGRMQAASPPVQGRQYRPHRRMLRLGGGSTTVNGSDDDLSAARVHVAETGPKGLRNPFASF